MFLKSLFTCCVGVKKFIQSHFYFPTASQALVSALLIELQSNPRGGSVQLVVSQHVRGCPEAGLVPEQCPGGTWPHGVVPHGLQEGLFRGGGVSVSPFLPSTAPIPPPADWEHVGGKTKLRGHFLCGKVLEACAKHKQGFQVPTKGWLLFKSNC